VIYTLFETPAIDPASKQLLVNVSLVY